MRFGIWGHRRSVGSGLHIEQNRDGRIRRHECYNRGHISLHEAHEALFCQPFFSPKKPEERLTIQSFVP